MELLSVFALHYLRCATRFRIPRPPHRCISINQSRTPPFFPPPPARRRFEQAQPAPTPKPKHDRARATPERRPTNHQIPFDHVFVLDPHTNKLSSTKQRLSDLLASRAAGHVVELVTSTPKPIVRVTTRNEVEAHHREMKRALRKGARVGDAPKVVQFTCGVAKADLEHKLRKARCDLEKGYPVAVVVTKRRSPSRQQLVAFANEIVEALSEVGKEWKEREFTERAMTLSFRKVELVQDDIP